MKPGERFGSLVVIEVLAGSEIGEEDGSRWARVRCDCGLRKRLRVQHLRLVKTCGRGKLCALERAKREGARAC
jgi:hypothetical protein